MFRLPNALPSGPRRGTVPHVRLNRLQYIDAIKRDGALLDDGVVDTLGLVAQGRRKTIARFS
jgi:hypothetical protein